MTEEELAPRIFAGILALVWGLVTWKGGEAEKDTMGLLVLVWAASAYFVWLMETDAPIWPFFTIDIIAGVSLYALRQRRVRWQGGVIGLFAAMVLVHLGFWTSQQYGGFGFQDITYNRMLNSLFYLQILFCGWVGLRTYREAGGYVVSGWYSRIDSWLFAPYGIDKPGEQGGARG